MKQLSILSLVLACAALAACNRPANVTTQTDTPAMGQSGAMSPQPGASSASAPAN